MKRLLATGALSFVLASCGQSETKTPSKQGGAPNSTQATPSKSDTPSPPPKIEGSPVPSKTESPTSPPPKSGTVQPPPPKIEGSPKPFKNGTPAPK